MWYPLARHHKLMRNSSTFLIIRSMTVQTIKGLLLQHVVSATIAYKREVLKNRNLLCQINIISAWKENLLIWLYNKKIYLSCTQLLSIFTRTVSPLVQVWEWKKWLIMLSASQPEMLSSISEIWSVREWQDFSYSGSH